MLKSNPANSPAAKLLLGAFLLLGGAAAAEAASQTHVFAGGGVISLDLFDRVCNQPVNNGGSHSFTITYRCEENRETGYNAFVGYQFNRHWSVELGWLQANGFDYSGEGPYTTTADHPVGAGSGDLTLTNGTIDISTIYLAGIGRYPLTRAFALTARAGVHQWDYESCGTITHTAVTGTAPVAGYSCKTSDDTDLLYGVGADWDFADNLRVRVALTRYRIGSQDMDIVGADLVYLFRR